MRQRLFRLLSTLFAASTALAQAPAGSAPPAVAPPPPAAEVLLVRGVTLIDGTGAEPRAETSVRIEDGRIVAVGGVAEVTAPEGARVIEGEGRFLIPGLWDSAVQLDDSEMWHYSPPDEAREQLLSLCVAAGVTGVRCFGGDLERLHEWRARIQLGELVGPRILCSGPWLDGASPVKPGAIEAENTGVGRQKLDRVADSGADFAAVYSRLRTDVFLAIADRARERGMPLAGRVPQLVEAIPAAEAGLTVQVTLGAYVRAMYDRDEMQRQIMAIPIEISLEERRLRQIEVFFSGVVPELRDRLFRTLRNKGVFVVPALVVQERRGDLDPRDERVARYLPYVPEHMREWWKPENNPDLKYLSESWKRGEAAIFGHYVELVRDLHAAGVQILAGTDFGSNPLVVPGFALHDELEHLVSAGLTPMEALLAATSLPARSLGLAGDLGTVEVGKLADLVLLDANPLEDISNTRRVAGVVTGGRYLAREDLAALLAATVKTSTVPARVGPDGRLHVGDEPR